MRKLTFFIVALLGLTQSKAQNKAHTWGVSFTPALVSSHSTFYGLQLGAEYNFSTRLSLLTELAVPIKGKSNPFVTEEKFIRLKPELRYFLSKRWPNAGAYTGLQVSYAARSWNATDGMYFEERLYEDSAMTFQSASVHSPVFTSSLQGGCVIPVGDQFALDLFAGFGVRIINTTYSDILNSSKVHAPRPNCQVMFSPDPAWWVNGTITRPHFNLGFRFLYRF